MNQKKKKMRKKKTSQNLIYGINLDCTVVASYNVGDVL
jgi:hypothetical protein